MIALFQILILNQDHPNVINSDSLIALKTLKTFYYKNTMVFTVQQFL